MSFRKNLQSTSLFEANHTERDNRRDKVPYNP